MSAVLLEQMFRMRARVFGERLGWDVTTGKNVTRTTPLILATS
jgi:N-acyl-L-homoserine lactone synthetase